MNLYADYTDESRSAMCFMESACLAADRACYLVEACDAMRDFDIREAEIKCVEESGDALELMDFYEAAAEKTEDKKKGILVRAWEAIVNALKSIKTALFGDKGPQPPEDPNAPCEIDKGEYEKISRLSSIWTKFKGFFVNPESGKVRTAPILVAIAAITAVVIGKKGKITVKAGTLFKHEKTQAEMTNAMEKGAKGMLNKVMSSGKTEGNDSEKTSIFNQLKGLIKESTTSIKNAYNSVKKGAKDNFTKAGRDAKKAAKEAAVKAAQNTANMTGEAIKGQVAAAQQRMQEMQDAILDQSSAKDLEELFAGTDLFVEDTDLFSDFDSDFSDDNDLFAEDVYNDDDLFEEDAASCEEIDELLDGII